MNRPGTVADAVAAVIAARVHQELAALGLELPEAVYLGVGVAAAEDVRAGGWSITPPHPTDQSQPQELR